MSRLIPAHAEACGMERRRLGKTNEEIPVIGMGTWNMGSTENPDERQEQLGSLKRGIELGMTLLDTAEMYGNGKSEQLVGEAIRDRRDSVFIATKVWPNHLRFDDVIDACRNSIRRLGVSYVDLYQVHWPNPRIPIRDTMSAMEKLLRDGLTRYIGVSNFSVRQAKEAQEALTKSELVSNQVEYSLARRTIERNVLPYCEKERITVIAYSPLGSGELPEAMIPRSVLDKYHLTPAQAALSWVTFKEAVVAIPKSAKRSHTEENAGVASIRLSDEDYELMSGRT
jgi:diketogulonate reductase-like aldo/keto reductase